MRTFTGLATARGFASGPVFLYRGEGSLAIPDARIAPGEEEAEVVRLDRARHAARRDIETLGAALCARTGQNDMGVFESHRLMLDDPLLVDGAVKYIREQRYNAAAAAHQIANDIREKFAKMDDAFFRERVRDLDDVERRLLSVLLDARPTSPIDLKEPSIVVADDLTPSETVRLPREFVLGFATNGGSATCHVAVLARALGIPAVSGLADITSQVENGAMALLDGTNGTITVAPDDDALAAFQHHETAARTNRDNAMDNAALGTLADGSRVLLYANSQPGIPLEPLRASGARGIGLYRTEYHWLEREREPTEEEQFEDYRRVAQFATTLSPEATVTIRTLDIGGDKTVHGITSHETNPFLGNRSIRYLLANPAVFRTQLRAILRASAFGPICLMYPMVSCVEELTEAAKILDDVKCELTAQGIAFSNDIPVGAMIEVPAAAINAESLARHVSFFSIGTNDLVQYTMAADRANDAVSHLYQPMHPALLWLVRHTLEAAKHSGVRVGVCGESAADPVLGILWAAMGADMLSMSLGSLASVSSALAHLARADLAAYADYVASLDTTQPASTLYDAAHAWLKARVPNLDAL